MEDQSSSSPRRSKRDRTSTLTWIDGHAILKQNNYVVRGDTYVHGQEGDDHAPIRKQPTQQPAKQHTIKRPKTLAPHELRRMEHNDHVRQIVRPKLRWHLQFWKLRYNLLRNFCEESVLETYRQQPNQSSSFVPSPVNKAPKAIQATLRDYQMQGLKFMVNMDGQNLPMILGDEMGLGKTLQTISFLCWLKENQNVTGPSLVICPLSVLSSWCNEMSKWAPSLKFFRLHASNPEEQTSQKTQLSLHATEYDIILTTYEMAKVPLLRSLYQRLHFHYLVLDEGHKIKGHQTQISQAVRGVHCGNKLLLTGTPLQNNMVELWSLLNFLYPNLFTTAQPFEDAFNLSENIVDKPFLHKAQKLLDLVMLRRLKHKVEQFIPPKLETKVYCPLSKTQTFWYKSLLMKDMSQLAGCEQAESGNGTLGRGRASMLKSLFMQLRKCCNHPFVFDGAEIEPGSSSLEELVAASGKLAVLDMLLSNLSKKGHRSVLFSQFTSILDIIEDYCILRGWKYCRLDGGTDRARRNYYIRRFNEENSPYFLFLVSTRSGGMGLNLQSADTCILYDSDWNPQSDIQAMGRVHRIGQTKTVHVYRLVSSGTIEERMLERAEKKLLLEMVNRESNTPNDDEEVEVRGLSAAELLDDIKFGSQAVFGSSQHQELPSIEDIEIITDRKRKESDSVGKLQGNTMQSAEEFDATKSFSKSQLFGGKDFSTIREEQKAMLKKQIPSNLYGIGNLWQEIQQLSSKRNRKNRIDMVAGTGSGYGGAVPVLKSNNYDLENGESSVFDRELKSANKSNFGVVKNKKKNAEFENQDFCQVCGDGGSLICCPRCPVSLHLSCIGLRNGKDFLCCTHHRCTQCGKKRESAGGLLYPCSACSNSYCEDCLPNEKEITFLENHQRFEALGFELDKAVYILCSNQCRQVAQAEFGYCRPATSKSIERFCPDPLDVSFGFGAGSTLEEQIEEVQNEKMKEIEKQGHNLRARKVGTPRADVSAAAEFYNRWKESKNGTIVKRSPRGAMILGVYANEHDAIDSVPAKASASRLTNRLKKASSCIYVGYTWELSMDIPVTNTNNTNVLPIAKSEAKFFNTGTKGRSATSPIMIDCTVDNSSTVPVVDLAQFETPSAAATSGSSANRITPSDSPEKAVEGQAKSNIGAPLEEREL